MRKRPLWLLHDSLLFSAEENLGKTALNVNGTDYSYSRLLTDVIKFAAVLHQNGLNRGDRVALYLDNAYANVVSIYAILYAGGAFIVINPQTKSDKLGYIINNSEAKILISDSHLFPQLTPIFSKLSSLKCFFYTISNKCPSIPEKYNCNTREFFTAIKQSEPLSIAPSIIPNDLAALIYTSGSTGNPKGVMLSHQAMLFAAQSLSQYLRLDDSHTIINVLPVAFDYGLYQILMSVLCGATLVLERSFTYPAQIFKLINKYKVTVFPGVPTMYTTIIGMHRRKPLCFPSVKRITNTAAALPADYNEELHQIFPNALIYRMYGLTECKRVCYLEPELADKKPSSVGKAIPGTEVFITTSDGQHCGPNEIGTLYVRGPHVMMGYWKEPELSAKMLKPGLYPGERVLCTHDQFKMDKDEDLYFVGRSDDIIKSRGEKISPIEIENTLLSLKGIREAAVIGVADELLGQAVKAFVALDDHTLTVQTIKKYCTDRLENFMIPKHIEIVQELPKTESGKITKKNLK